MRFFQCIVEDNEKPENLESSLKRAYADTLAVHHGWMGTQLFNVINQTSAATSNSITVAFLSPQVISKFAPSRKDLLYKLALDKPNREEHVLRDMRAFTVELAECVAKLMEFYVVHDLERFNRSR